MDKCNINTLVRLWHGRVSVFVQPAGARASTGALGRKPVEKIILRNVEVPPAVPRCGETELAAYRMSHLYAVGRSMTSTGR
jgi:hypothetical protein